MKPEKEYCSKCHYSLGTAEPRKRIGKKVYHLHCWEELEVLDVLLSIKRWDFNQKAMKRRKLEMMN